MGGVAQTEKRKKEVPNLRRYYCFILTLLAVPILVLWVGLRKQKKQKKGVPNLKRYYLRYQSPTSLFAVPILVLRVGLQKQRREKTKLKLKLGCEK